MTASQLLNSGYCLCGFVWFPFTSQKHGNSPLGENECVNMYTVSCVGTSVPFLLVLLSLTECLWIHKHPESGERKGFVLPWNDVTLLQIKRSLGFRVNLSDFSFKILLINPTFPVRMVRRNQTLYHAIYPVIDCFPLTACPRVVYIT